MDQPDQERGRASLFSLPSPPIPATAPGAIKTGHELVELRRASVAQPSPSSPLSLLFLPLAIPSSSPWPPPSPSSLSSSMAAHFDLSKPVAFVQHAPAGDIQRMPKWHDSAGLSSKRRRSRRWRRVWVAEACRRRATVSGHRGWHFKVPTSLSHPPRRIGALGL